MTDKPAEDTLQSKEEPHKTPQSGGCVDSSIPEDAALRQAVVDYRVMCDSDWQDRNDGALTQEEYEKSIAWRLDKLMQLLSADKQTAVTRALEELLTHKFHGSTCIDYDCTDIGHGYEAVYAEDIQKQIATQGNGGEG
jgi:hypothetical protein